MSDCYIYDVYKPKAYKLPFDFEAKFRYVHKIGAKLLNRFSEQQLIDATRRLDRAVLDSDAYWYRITMEDWEDPDSAADYSDSKDGFLRHAMQKQLDMNDLLGLDNVTWAECYALGGISLLAYAARLELYQFRQQDEIKEKNRDPNRCPTEIKLDEMMKRMGGSQAHDFELQCQWNIGEYAVESSKLAAIAAVLASSEISAAEYQGFHRKNGAKGGEKRAQRFDPFKALVLGIARERFGDQSAAKAAKSTLGALSDEQKHDEQGQAYLFSDEPDKTVARWIREDRKATA